MIKVARKIFSFLMILTIYEQFLKISVESHTPKFISYIRVKCEKIIIENH